MSFRSPNCSHYDRPSNPIWRDAPLRSRHTHPADLSASVGLSPRVDSSTGRLTRRHSGNIEVGLAVRVRPWRPARISTAHLMIAASCVSLRLETFSHCRSLEIFVR